MAANNIDNNDADSKEDELHQPTFRIRFTISNNNNNSSSRKENHHYNDSNCNGNLNERKCSHQIERETTTSTITTIRSSQLNVDDNNKSNRKSKSSFQFLQPQNHKSSLFVNLGGSRDNGANNNSHETENHLFISPDLDQFIPASPPSSVDSTFCLIDPEPGELPEIRDSSPDSDTMSQGCNFMNSLMVASRRRSSSVTPQAQKTKAPAEIEPSNNGRRASSSDDLVAPVPNNPLANKSSSGNHLAVVGMSNETICGTDSTQVNKPIVNNSDGYVQLSAMNMGRSLRIEINDMDEDNTMDKWPPAPAKSYDAPKHPVSLDDILQIDLDENRLEDERKNLENLVKIWEQKVDEMERRRFADDVPRTLIEKVLQQRKELRDLECQLYKIGLEESLDQTSPSSHKLFESQFSPAQDEFGSTGNGGGNGDRIMKTTAASNRIGGSHLRPGQENTADILEYIPPASSLQYKQYLNRASTGTDSSEYSQLPNYDIPHKHPLQNNETNQRHNTDSSNHHHRKQYRHRQYQTHTRQHQHHYSQREQQEVYVQLDSPEVSNNKPRSSPIRPNYFKDDFKSSHVDMSQDSNSTASSSSPH